MLFLNFSFKIIFLAELHDFEDKPVVFKIIAVTRQKSSYHKFKTNILKLAELVLTRYREI